MPYSSCDENRLQLAREAQSNLNRARELAKTQDHAGALECYLFAFDNSLAVDGWGGVRLSYIPSEIAELSKKYPPARIALEIRRNAREELIREGEKDFDVVSEWTSLNRSLGEKDRELVLLQELQDRGVLDKSLKDRIIDSNFERLLVEKRYDFLSEYLDHCGHKFLFQIFHYEEAALFPEKYKLKGASTSMTDYWKQHIRDEGAKVFELALGTKKNLQADEIAKRILLHCNDADSYNKLMDAASRAGQKNKARELSKQALTSLTEDEYRKVQEV
jgi:hypothetical protein